MPTLASSFRVPAEPVQSTSRSALGGTSAIVFTTDGIASAGGPLLGCCFPLATLRWGLEGAHKFSATKMYFLFSVKRTRSALPPLGFSPKILGFSIESWDLGFSEDLGFFQRF